MFPTSTQLRFWTFSGTTELNKLRSEANHKYIKDHGNIVPDQLNFLVADEERILCRHYECVLKSFCAHFQPPMPTTVVGTSLAFFKRFYLHHSVMNYHPREIVYTCVYLACKVEEFNVSITQFVANMTGDKEKATDIILSQELLLMQKLQYHLTIHNPYRPLEGLLIDIKARCSDIEDAEALRKGADEFLDRSLNTDICLVFSPSQIALAALLSSSSKLGINLESYVTNTLLGAGDKDEQTLMKTVEHVKRIRYMAKNQEPLNRDQIKRIEDKLKICRNPKHNPYSNQYKDRLVPEDEDDPERSSKRRKMTEEERFEAAETADLFD